MKPGLEKQECSSCEVTALEKRRHRIESLHAHFSPFTLWPYLRFKFIPSLTETIDAQQVPLGRNDSFAKLELH
jgi:hypothetical protein